MKHLIWIFGDNFFSYEIQSLEKYLLTTYDITPMATGVVSNGNFTTRTSAIHHACTKLRKDGVSDEDIIVQ